MRNDDLSQPQERSHKVRCYNCQREAQRQVKLFTGQSPMKSTMVIWKSKKKHRVNLVRAKYFMSQSVTRANML